MLFHKVSNYSSIRVFSCSCYPFLRLYNHHKLAFRSGRCVFLGYSSLHKGYLCLHSSGKVCISNHVVFYEPSFPFESGVQFSSSSSSCSSQYSLEFVNEHSISPLIHFPFPQTAVQPDSSPSSSSASANDSASNPPSFSSLKQSLPPRQLSPNIQSHQPIQGHHMITRSKAGIFKPKLAYVVNCHFENSEPSSVSAALKNPVWFQAIKEEYKALIDNKTWTLVKPSISARIVGNKWVYRVKYNSDGSIDKYKARLVVKGFHQTAGVDYNKTFSPVIKASTIKVILSLAVMNHWSLRQVDINNVFLHGYLNAEVYMQQPEDFVDQSRPTHVCKLQKALYGLK